LNIYFKYILLQLGKNIISLYLVKHYALKFNILKAINIFLNKSF